MAGSCWHSFLAILQNFFNQANIGGFWQLVVKGGIIIMAVGIDSYSKKPHRRPLRATLNAAFGRGGQRINRSRSPGIARDEHANGAGKGSNPRTMC